jgi:hypothetical protein
MRAARAGAVAGEIAAQILCSSGSPEAPMRSG